MHAVSAQVLSTTANSSNIYYGNNPPGHPMSSTIGASSTDSHQNQLSGAPLLAAPVSNTPSLPTPHEHIAGAEYPGYYVPPPANMYPPAGATAYGLPTSFVPVAAPPVGAPPTAGTISALPDAVLLGPTQSGAVGQAAASPQPYALAQVPTKDSVTDYGTQAPEMVAPSAHAPMQVRSLPMTTTSG